MAIMIDEQKMIEDNVFQYENKLKSPMSRFLDTTPTFVTYYHINADESTTDEGFKDVASIIGFRSPLKFKKIKNFPLYGIEQVVLQIQDADQGLDTEFSSEATILPNTIKPLENDFFMIPYLHDVYLFRVTEISYDNVMTDNFYKINYQLEFIDQEKVDSLNKQANESYTCILENIGSENKCIIESENMEKIRNIEAMYDDIAQTYMTLFYDDRHNCLLGDFEAGKKIYDPFQTEFINKHSLFNKKNNLQTILLTDEFTDTRRRIKYEKSLYRCIERRETSLVNNFKYVVYQGCIEHESSFYRWADKQVQILDIPPVIPEDAYELFNDKFVVSVRNNGFTDSQYGKLIQDFIRNKPLTIHDIPLSLNEELMYLSANLEVFFFTPIIMYIIQTIVNESIKKQ